LKAKPDWIFILFGSLVILFPVAEFVDHVVPPDAK